ncbi:MAG: GntR family transcriptional regulator [Kaiparowitsia implicata GSE-PSE-MK54-09C]|jgi:DNA-binding GntR family transcriptional regulator|nr:GntR family transcriptional regulator [Kaiparowitsia implicata GSE-PSE-MK54-09C]
MEDGPEFEDLTKEAGALASRKKGQLHTEAASRLRSMILSGELPPGARLREVQLCDQLGVSRTPVREAFRTLAAERLVDLLPNRSVVVSELHAPDLEDLFLVFGSIEGLAAELACQRITEAEVGEIGRLLAEMIDFHGRQERAPYMRINQQIHRRTVEIAANPVLLSVWQSLIPRVERARALANLDTGRWTGALIEHTKMFTALASRDGALLAQLTRQHFLNSLPFLQARADRKG